MCDACTQRQYLAANTLDRWTAHCFSCCTNELTIFFALIPNIIVDAYRCSVILSDLIDFFIDPFFVMPVPWNDFMIRCNASHYHRLFLFFLLLVLRLTSWKQLGCIYTLPRLFVSEFLINTRIVIVTIKNSFSTIPSLLSFSCSQWYSVFPIFIYLFCSFSLHFNLQREILYVHVRAHAYSLSLTAFLPVCYKYAQQNMFYLWSS